MPFLFFAKFNDCCEAKSLPFLRYVLNTKGNRRIFWAGKRFCGLDIIPGWVCRNAGGFVEEIVSLLYYQLL